MSILRCVDTIGNLRAELAAFDQSLPILLDGRAPTALSSYRGYYDQLAIERNGNGWPETALAKPGRSFDSDILGHYQPGSSEVRIKTGATVGDLHEALGLAIGATFEGYKGGQFTMTAHTDIWVAEYGECGGIRICGIRDVADHVEVDLIEVPF